MSTYDQTSGGHPHTLYDRLGGRNGIQIVVQDFYRRVLLDPELNSYFARSDMGKLMEHQTLFVSFATGGPDFYTGQSLTQSHEVLKIKPEHFDRTLSYLKDSLEFGGVSPSDVGEVMALLRPLRSRIATPENK